MNTGRSDREIMVVRMAAELVRYKAFDDERAAMRTLSGRGFALGDITMLVDAARSAAKETAAIEAKVAVAMQETFSHRRDVVNAPLQPWPPKPPRFRGAALIVAALVGAFAGAYALTMVGRGSRDCVRIAAAIDVAGDCRSKR